MKFNVEVPNLDNLVEEVTQAALTQALSKNSDKVIKEIVKGVLMAPVEGRTWDKQETLLRKALRNAIQDHAKKTVSIWLEANADRVAEMVDAECKKMLSAAMVAEAVSAALGNVSVKLKPFKPVEPEDNHEDDDEDE